MRYPCEELRVVSFGGGAGVTDNSEIANGAKKAIQ